MANKQVTIEFKAEDKGLVDQLTKLDNVSKKLTSTQVNLKKANDAHLKDYKKHNEAQKKRNTEISNLRRSLKKVGADFKTAGIATKTHTRAIQGSKINLIKLRIQTQKYLNTLKKQRVQTTKTAARTRLLGGTFAVLRSKILLANFAMGLGIRQLGKFGVQASKVESMERAFETLTGGTELASDSLVKLKDATNSTMSEFDLFQQANNAMILGVTKNSDEMAEMFDIAQRLGRALGKDTASSVESLITGIGRQSRLMLDNIGIIVKADEAYESYAKTLKVNVDELSDADKKQAFLTATMESARAKVASLGEEVVSNQDKYDELKASASNLTAELGNTLQPLLLALGGGFVAVADSISEVLKLQSHANVEVSKITTLEGKRKQLLADIELTQAALNSTLFKTLLNQETILQNEKLLADKKYELRKTNFLILNQQKDQKALAEKQTAEALKLAKAEKDRLDKAAQDKIDKKERLKFLKNRDKKIEKQKKDHEAFMVKLEKDKQSARQIIFENDLQFQLDELKAKGEQFKALKLNAEEQVQLEKWLKNSKATILKEDADKHARLIADSQKKIKDARAIIFEDNLDFQMQELALERDRLSTFTTNKKEEIALEEWFYNKKRDLQQQNFEETSILYNSSFSAYDAFVTSMLDTEQHRLKTEKAMKLAFKDAFIRFLGDMIKEQIKAYVLERTLQKTQNKITEAESIRSGAVIASANAPAATAVTLARGPAYVLAVGAAVAAFVAAQKFEKGGEVGGNRHSQGGTLIEAEKGEFVMSRNAVESIGLENLTQMNATGSGGVTVNIQGNMIGNEEFVRDTLIPEINKTVNQGLA